MKKIDKDNSLDFFYILKFIGSVCIAIFLHYNDHLLPYLKMPNPFFNNHFLEYVSKNSYVFVEMFFIISGVLFTKVYFNKIIFGMEFKDFIKKKIIRIFPLMIITTILMYLGNYILFEYNGELWRSGTLSIWHLFLNIMFGGTAIFNIPNTLNGPIWYINVLMLCYVIAFLLTKISKKLNNNFLFVIPILLGLFIRYSNGSYVLWNTAISRGYVSFFTGVMLFNYFDIFDKMKYKKRFIIKITLLFELILFIVIVANNTNAVYILDHLDNILCYNFFFFPELILLLYNNKIVNKICGIKLFKFLGNISFGMYLWNFPILITFHILYTMKLISIPVISKWFIIVNFVVHMIVSSISYIIVDKMLIDKLKRKYLK